MGPSLALGGAEDSGPVRAPRGRCDRLHGAREWEICRLSISCSLPLLLSQPFLLSHPLAPPHNTQEAFRRSHLPRDLCVDLYRARGDGGADHWLPPLDDP